MDLMERSLGLFSTLAMCRRNQSRQANGLALRSEKFQALLMASKNPGKQGQKALK
jgi:hypothetical protein